MRRSVTNRGQYAAATCESLEERRLLSGELAWAVTSGMPERLDAANAVATDAAGNTYVAGVFRGRMDMDPRRNVSRFVKSRGDEDDIFIAKYSPQGSLIWARSFGGPEADAATHIEIMPTGGVIVAGTFRGTADFAPGRATLELKSNGRRDAFILRLDRAGRPLWVGKVGGRRDDFITAIAAGPDGDVYIAGTVRLAGDLDPGPGVRNITTRGVDDTFISRLDGATGNLKWAKVFGENDTREGASGMVVAGDGSVFVAGTFNRTVEFDRGPSPRRLRSNGGDDIYLGRLDGAGNWQWLRNIGGRKDDSAVALRAGPEGDLYISGNFSKQVNFNPAGAASNLTSLGDADAYVARYRPNGELVWAGQFGGKDALIVARALAVDAAGHAYAVGQFRDVVDFDPGPGQRLLDATKSNSAARIGGQRATDAYLVKLTGAGRLVYAQQIGGEDGSVAAYGVSADPDGNLYAAGAMAGTVDLNPGAGRLIYRTADDRDDTDVFLLKLLG